MTTTTGLGPESTLYGLNRRLRKLLSSATIILQEAGSREIPREILSFYRQTAIAELFYDRFIITVAGLQGVGKTTLMRELYDIPKVYLPENAGRGEKLPVVISEHDPQYGCQTWVKRAQMDGETGYRVTDEELSPEEFFRTARQPGEFDLWLELKVPQRHFLRPDRALVLLPGIEETEDQQGREWQLFVQHSLTMATTCLIVFDQTKFAQANNQSLVERLVRDFRAAKPLMALSRSDQWSPEQNAQFRRQVMERFGIGEQEGDRVILTGVGEGYPIEWTGQLVAAIEKYSVIPREYRRNQMQHMEQILSDFAVTLGKIQDELNQYDQMTEAKADADYAQLLRIFDSARATVRRKVAREVRTLVLAHQTTVITEIQNNIAGRSNWRKTIQTILGASFAEQLAFTREVEEAWERPRSSGNSEGGAEETPPLHLTFTLNRRLQALLREQLQEFAERTAAAGPTSTLPTEEQGELPLEPGSVLIRPEIIENLNGYFVIPTDDPGAVPALKEESLRLIPLAILARLNLALIGSGVGVTEKDGKLVLPRLSSELSDQLKLVSMPQRSIVNGMAVIFGLDAVDGTINTVPALLNALGVPATAAATSIGVALTGLASLIYVAGQVTRQVAKQDFKDEDAAILLIRHYGEVYEQRVLDYLDDLLQDGRDRLERRVTQQLHKSKRFERWEALRQALRNVQDHIITTQEEFHGAVAVLG